MRLEIIEEGIAAAAVEETASQDVVAGLTRESVMGPGTLDFQAFSRQPVHHRRDAARLVQRTDGISTHAFENERG